MYATANNVGYLITLHKLQIQQWHADWAHLGSDIEIYEQSKTHAIASEVYYRWKVELTVDGQNLAEIKNATDYWEKVLRCHFDSSN